VTAPPPGWFYGIAADLSAYYRAGLVALGLEVFDVPVEPFLTPDPVRIDRLVSELRAFGPELAVGLSHGSYALICRLPARRGRKRRNLFTDVLDIPTLCLWDHAPLELADQLLAPLPADPAGSRRGALRQLRSALDHPRVIHWSRDRGQTRAMVELGLADPTRIVHSPTAAVGPVALRAAHPAAGGVGFVGHVYQEPVPRRDSTLDMVARDAYASWDAGSSPSLLEELTGRLERLSPAARSALSVSPDETYFWSFAHRFVIHEAQTRSRLAALGAAGVPVACVGNLDAGAPGVPANLVASSGRVRFGPELAEALTRYPVVLDVLNPGFVEGYSSKPMQGFAAGGFVLVNRTAGFVERFGDAGEAATWASHDELAAKVELYLSRPRLRDEVGDQIRAEIAASHTLEHVLCGVLDQAWELASPPSRRAKVRSRLRALSRAEGGSAAQ
jgi:hypothetical protein